MSSDHRSALASDKGSLNQGFVRLLARHVSAILWTADQSLMITSLTGGGLANFGRKPGEGGGKTLFEYFGTQDRQYPPIAAHLNALQGNIGDYEVEYQGRTFFSHVEPLRGETGEIVGVIGLGLDMTDTIRAQSALQDSEERFRSIFETSPVGIGIAFRGILRYANPALAQLFRYEGP